MEPIIDLIWTVEEEYNALPNINDCDIVMRANCGGWPCSGDPGLPPPTSGCSGGATGDPSVD